jgi:hypothetical protein
MVSVEVENRSTDTVDVPGAVELARGRPGRRGDRGGRARARVRPSRRDAALKRDHLGIDEATDVLSFPIDGRDELPAGLPRALGDVVLCPHVVGEQWRIADPRPAHLLGYDHGGTMERRERELAAGAAR